MLIYGAFYDNVPFSGHSMARMDSAVQAKDATQVSIVRMLIKRQHHLSNGQSMERVRKKQVNPFSWQQESTHSTFQDCHFRWRQQVGNKLSSAEEKAK